MAKDTRGGIPTQSNSRASGKIGFIGVTAETSTTTTRRTSRAPGNSALGPRAARNLPAGTFELCPKGCVGSHQEEEEVGGASRVGHSHRKEVLQATPCSGRAARAAVLSALGWRLT